MPPKQPSGDLKCDGCSQALGDRAEWSRFTYQGLSHSVHLSCAASFLKKLVPDTLPQSNAQLIREEIIQAIHQTNPPGHTKFK